jgi:hypothetical protein
VNVNSWRCTIISAFRFNSVSSVTVATTAASAASAAPAASAVSRTNCPVEWIQGIPVGITKQLADKPTLWLLALIGRKVFTYSSSWCLKRLSSRPSFHVAGIASSDIINWLSVYGSKTVCGHI